MNQKSFLRDVPQFVSRVLTGDSLDQQAINRGRADTEYQLSIGLVQLEPAMLLQRRQQRRDHDPSDGINTVALNSAYQVTNTS